MEENTHEDYFRGPERLGILDPIGRPLRCGDPSELLTGDKPRLDSLLSAGNAESALAYADLIFRGHYEMLQILFEWSLEWTRTALIETSEHDERICTEKSFQDWMAAIRSLKKNEHRVAILDQLSYAFGRDGAHPGLSEHFRTNRTDMEHRIIKPLHSIRLMQQVVTDMIRDKRLSEALRRLDEYWPAMIAAHDAMVQYCQSYPAAAGDLFGQEIAEKMVYASHSGCSFFEGLWQLGAILNSEGSAAFLAEHLRSHLSGANRGGSTGIVEDEYAYRLIFDPCGSGGAMRRRHATSHSVCTLSNPSPASWSLEGQVPHYCSHCAFNELESIKRFGYPLLVTEFDPDPAKPCGWTIYKEPSLIPNRYYERLRL